VPKVLIVDDDVDLIEGQKIFLVGKGYTVRTALSMKEGVEALESFLPDIIVVDLMMEHYDSGFVFCKKAREIPGLADVPMIMQTAAPKETGFTFDASNSKEREWMKVDEILTKPVPLEHLRGIIEQYLGRSKKNG
jgi:CheY-like chemotaxis protein